MVYENFGNIFEKCVALHLFAFNHCPEIQKLAENAYSVAIKGMYKNLKRKSTYICKCVLNGIAKMFMRVDVDCELSFCSINVNASTLGRMEKIIFFLSKLKLRKLKIFGGF